MKRISICLFVIFLILMINVISAPTVTISKIQTIDAGNIYHSTTRGTIDRVHLINGTWFVFHAKSEAPCCQKNVFRTSSDGISWSGIKTGGISADEISPSILVEGDKITMLHTEDADPDPNIWNMPLYIKEGTIVGDNISWGQKIKIFQEISPSRTYAWWYYDDLMRDSTGRLHFSGRFEDNYEKDIFWVRSTNPNDIAMWENQDILMDGAPNTLVQPDAHENLALEGDEAYVIFRTATHTSALGKFYGIHYDGNNWESQPTELGSSDGLAGSDRRLSAVYDSNQKKIHFVYIENDGDLMYRALSQPFNSDSWSSPSLVVGNAFTATLGIDNSAAPARLALVYGDDRGDGKNGILYLKWFDGADWEPSSLRISDPNEDFASYPNMIRDVSGDIGVLYLKKEPSVPQSQDIREIMFSLIQYPPPTQCIDNDGDNFGDPASSLCANPGLDCDDDDVLINPGATEVCDDNSDNDCDGFLDCSDPDCSALPECIDVCSNLKTLYHFDGNASDSSGNGNDGIVNGTTLVTGRFGQAFSFDGIDDFIEVTSNDVQFTSDFSVSFWVKADAVPGLNQEIILSRGDSKYLFNWGHSVEYQKSFVIWDNGWSNNCKAAISSPLSAGTWYHIVGTFDDSANTINIYLNGNLAESQPCLITPRTANNKLYVGSVGGGDAFDGAVDELAIYGRVLSQGEIDQLYSGAISCAGSALNCSDFDNDTYSPDGGGCGIIDCNDANAMINPGINEIYYNGINDDCNSATVDDDQDGDTFNYTDDCDDTNNLIYPYAIELCDNIDNQCPGNPGYGTTDEGCTQQNITGIIFEDDFSGLSSYPRSLTCSGGILANKIQTTSGGTAPPGWDGWRCSSGQSLDIIAGLGHDGSPVARYGWGLAGVPLAVNLFKHLTGDQNTGYNELYVRYKFKFDDDWNSGLTGTEMEYWKWLRLWQYRTVDNSGNGPWSEVNGNLDTRYILANFKGKPGGTKNACVGTTWSDNINGHSSNGNRYNIWYDKFDPISSTDGCLGSFNGLKIQKPGDSYPGYFETYPDGNQDWHTIEYRFKLSTENYPGNGVFEVWFDGVQQKDLTPGNSGVYDNVGGTATMSYLNTMQYQGGMNLLTVFDNMYAWTHGQGSTKYLYLDNVVVSTNPIGPSYVIGSSSSCDSDGDNLLSNNATCNGNDCDDSDPSILQCHRADTDQNNCVDDTELTTFIAAWKAKGTAITMPVLMSAIKIWKGCN